MTSNPDEFLAQEIVEARHAPGELSFRAGPQLAQLVAEWERSNDELVFRTQLETGSFHGRLRVDNPMQQEIMRMAIERGSIAPYYGLGGERGVCVYKFHPGPERCLVEVEHGATGAVLTFDAEALPPEEQPADHGARRYSYSFLPISAGDGPGATQPTGHLLCRITGREYEALASWQHWAPVDALAGRYWYEFGRVSMGSGLTVGVRDNQSGAELNATDYDSW